MREKIIDCLKSSIDLKSIVFRKYSVNFNCRRFSTIMYQFTPINSIKLKYNT
jgi:hypothetical protein